MVNEYLADAKYCMKRASAHLVKDEVTTEDLHDVLLYFALGVERLFKAILHEINPIFVLESQDFENAAAVLYTDKLTPGMQKKLEADIRKSKSPNSKVLTFVAAMYAAAKFSITVQDNTATFGHLAYLRNILAHHRLSQLDAGGACRFCWKHFFPTVEQFAAELKFAPADCIAGDGDELKKRSDKIVAEDKFAEEMKKLLEEHAKIWAERQKDAAAVQAAKEVTKAAYMNDPQSDTFAEKAECPACKNDAILFCQVDADYIDHEPVLLGAYVTGLECRFCDLEINEYEELDYFKLNRYLYGNGAK